MIDDLHQKNFFMSTRPVRGAYVDKGSQSSLKMRVVAGNIMAVAWKLEGNDEKVEFDDESAHVDLRQSKKKTAEVTRNTWEIKKFWINLNAFE